MHQEFEPVRIAVVVGSTRPGRQSEQVAAWVTEKARALAGDRARLELLDVAAFDLPLLDEPEPAAIGRYRHPHTRRWAAAVAEYDGFVFVTPEYNHAVPAALKNAIDYLFAEWNDKAAGFVSYGLNGGVRAVEQLRLSLAEVKMATVRSQVALSLFTDFESGNPVSPGPVRPGAHHRDALARLVEELITWSVALRRMRLPELLASS